MIVLHDQDIIVSYLWLGPSKGSALSVRHQPTGVCVQRTIGYEPEASHRRQLRAELEAEVCRYYQNPSHRPA